ncbi:hypothetical protein CQW23_14705 [Capsicum baccatum]|uniref:Uncharacterized protein n=1 Tax=Capsicum baccatum TaxID=33114 RepID=A0A2G2WJX7_CAPBA|nr:hypothetical protein CQW23_14705 [Capsicum baccatum]
MSRSINGNGTRRKRATENNPLKSEQIPNSFKKRRRKQAEERKGSCDEFGWEQKKQVDTCAFHFVSLSKEIPISMRELCQLKTGSLEVIIFHIGVCRLGEALQLADADLEKALDVWWLGETEEAYRSLAKAAEILRITHGTNTTFMKELFVKLEEARAELSYKLSSKEEE